VSRPCLHHIGVACDDIDRVREFIRRSHDVIGDSGIIDDPRQHVRLCLLTVADGLRIELISGDLVKNLIRSRVTYYHICYEVGDLQAAIASFQKSGCVVAVKPIPAVLFEDRRVAFLMSPMGLIELLEATSADSEGD